MSNLNKRVPPSHPDHPAHLTWRSWRAIKGRIGSKNSYYYGMEMEKDWLKSFEAFLSDVGLRPSAKHSADRLDGSRGYVRGNFRWATTSEQLINRRITKFLTIDGETRSTIEWSKITGVSSGLIKRRISVGIDPKECILPAYKPKRRERKRLKTTLLAVKGETRTIYEWAKIVNIQPKTIYQRIKRGWPAETCLGQLVPKTNCKIKDQLKLTLEGKTMTFRAWSKELGIPYSTIITRFRRNLPPEQILSLKRLPRSPSPHQPNDDNHSSQDKHGHKGHPRRAV